MLDWLHSGSSVHDGVWLDQDDVAAHTRLDRYCARCPVSLDRLEYDAATATVTYTSGKADGPTAGRHMFEATDFIARLVALIPDKRQVLQRYYGFYANRTRGERRKAQEAGDCAMADATRTAASGADDSYPPDGLVGWGSSLQQGTMHGRFYSSEVFSSVSDARASEPT